MHVQPITDVLLMHAAAAKVNLGSDEAVLGTHIRLVVQWELCTFGTG